MAAVGLHATRSHDAEWLFFLAGYYISLSYERAGYEVRRKVRRVARRPTAGWSIMRVGRAREALTVRTPHRYDTELCNWE
jgi:hypothetical protein